MKTRWWNGRARGCLALLGAALAGCGGGSVGGGAWSVEDSAGVTVVRNPAAADWEHAPRPVLEVDLRIGTVDGPAEYQFGAVRSIDVGDDGRIYVLDRQASNVRVYDAGGTYLRTLGRPGGGPGELSNRAEAVMVGPGDTVYVADIGGRRVQAFAPDGSPAGSAPLPTLTALGTTVTWAVTPRGELLVHSRPIPVIGAMGGGPPLDRVLRWTPGAAALDTLLEIDSGQSVEVVGGVPRPRIFAAEATWAALADGRMVHGLIDRYRLLVSHPDGALERVVTRAVEPRRITDAEKQAILDLLRGEMQNAPMPAEMSPEQARQMGQMMAQMMASVEIADEYPVLGRLFGGPGNTIWAQRVPALREMLAEGSIEIDAPSEATRTWDVFDAEGRLLGAAQLPPRFTPLRTHGDAVYGVERDELGVNHVLRLRVGS